MKEVLYQLQLPKQIRGIVIIAENTIYYVADKNEENLLKQLQTTELCALEGFLLGILRR